MNAKEVFALAMKAREENEKAKALKGQIEEERRFRASQKRDKEIEELTQIIKELIVKAAKKGELKITFDAGEFYYSADVTFRVMKKLEYEGYSTDCIKEDSYYPYAVEDDGYLTDYEIELSNTVYDASIYSISWEHIVRQVE